MKHGLEKGAPLIALSCFAVLLIGAGAIRRYATQEPAEETRASATSAVASDTKDVLKSSFAGSWYSADANELRNDIAGYLAKAQAEPREDVIALVLPHAGYAYSGPTAACGIKSLGRNYQRVIVIGPTHHLPMEDTFSVPRTTHVETPLGQTPLDVGFIAKLLEYPLFQSIPTAHRQEHSVEIEIPLLQHKLGDFKLVPIVAGRCSPETAARAGRILAGLIDGETLVVASSDFTHYGPQYRYVPFTENIPESIKRLDMDAFEFIRKLDAKGLLTYRDQMHATICGCVPVAVLLEMLGKDTKVELLGYTTSGEMAGSYSNSVSYMAVAFQGAWGNAPAPAAQASRPSLTAEDRKQLLALGRRTLRYALDRQMMPEASDLDFTASEPMRLPRAAFVTLKKDGKLRGCIGDIFPQRPLYKSVLGNAVYAAFGDRRFQPLRSEEYEQIKIEISALTAPTPVASPQEIRIGIDGIVLNKDGRSAVFLSQVALEQGWDLETTLQQLSLKAGLPANAWEQDASFLVFQADVFGEEL
jgi:hypothetical protein